MKIRKKKEEKTNRGVGPAYWTAHALAHGLAHATTQQRGSARPSIGFKTGAAQTGLV
jgi:hypothetical protein